MSKKESKETKETKKSEKNTRTKGTQTECPTKKFSDAVDSCIGFGVWQQWD